MLKIICFCLLSLGFVFAQDYSGFYTQQDDPTTTLELRLSPEGYAGTLLDSGKDTFRVQGQLEDGLLFGFIFLTDANYPQDLFFGAELSAEQLLLTTAFMNDAGEIDNSSFTELVFVRSLATPANPLGQTQEAPVTPANPLGQAANPNPLAPSATQPLANAANATVIQADQVYQAGTALSSPSTGVSFSILEGFQGGYDSAEAAFYVVAQDQTQVLALQAASNASASQLGQATLQTIADSLTENAQVQELAAPQVSGDSFTATYTIDGTVLHLLAKQGTAGNAVLIVGYGTQTIVQTVNNLAATLSFSQPQSNLQNSQLGGRDFFSNKTSSYYSPGGVGDGSFASGTERAYTFCSNGSYGFQYSSESFMSVEGAGSMSSTDSDAHQGNYTLSKSLMGNIVIFLQASDGRSFVTELQEVTEGVLIDGFLYDVSQSQQCQ